jgi:uncharacterized membrane protein (UPF0127 family)
MIAQRFVLINLTVLLIILVAQGISSCTNFSNQDPADRLAGYEVSELRIFTKDGRQLQFTVYLATSKEQRAQGLSHVIKLPVDEGMLFVFPGPQRINMWMKDTPSSLDLLFIDQKGIITRIVENTVPDSTTIISSDGDAVAVLEVNAGTARQLRITTGDTVHHVLLNKNTSDPGKTEE